MQSPQQGMESKKGSMIRRSKEQHLSWAAHDEDGATQGGRGGTRLHQDRVLSGLHQSTSPREKEKPSDEKASTTSPRSEGNAKTDTNTTSHGGWRPPPPILKNVGGGNKPSPAPVRKPGSFLVSGSAQSRPSGSTLMPRAFDCPLNDDLKLLADFKDQERKGTFSGSTIATAPYQFIGDQVSSFSLTDFEPEGREDVEDVIDLERITKLSDDLTKNYKKWFQEMTSKVESRKTFERKRRFAKDYTPRKDVVHKGGREKDKNNTSRRLRGKEKRTLKEKGEKQKDKGNVKDKASGRGQEKDTSDVGLDKSRRSSGGNKETTNRDNNRLLESGTPPAGSPLLGGGGKKRLSAKIGVEFQDRGGLSDREGSDGEQKRRPRNGESSFNGDAGCNGNGDLKSGKGDGSDDGLDGEKKGKIKGKR